jgi:predicted metal-dependent hydrolase
MNLLIDHGLVVEIQHSSKRKTVELYVDHGKVRIVVPSSLDEQRIRRILESKKNWIRQKLRIQSEFLIPKGKEYVSGESFSYLGKNYRLKVSQTGRSEVKLRSGRLEVGVDRGLTASERKKTVRESLMRWYRDRAEDRLQEKTARYAKILGAVPQSVKVREFKSRWGSCSVRNDIAFNWRIIVAPHRIVDYVVVHELSHLIKHDHSEQFWKTIERVLPDYRERKDWLRWNGMGLLVS